MKRTTEGPLFLTSEQIDKAVRVFFSGQGVTVLSQVRNGTGFERSARTADMFAISTWPSRGLYCEGIEIKSYKYDLIRELENPKKADDIAKYCRYWWLATAEGLSEGLTLPPKWGLLEIGRDLKAKVKIKPVQLEPTPMDDLFVCSVIRNFAESYTLTAEINATIEERVQAALQQRRDYRDKDLEEMAKAVKAWEEITGVSLFKYGHLSYDFKKVARAVKILMAVQDLNLEAFEQVKHGLEAGQNALKLIAKAPNLEG